MFTGIVEERGQVRTADSSLAGMRLAVDCRTVAEDAVPGASIAVNGVCLTVVDRDGSGLLFDLVGETLERSSLADLHSGDSVNLERPVTLMTRLGGHLVQGHVDGVGTIDSLVRDEDSATMTVAVLDGKAFTVALVPHTLAQTTLGERRAGDRVNLEVDIVSKYVEKLVRRDR
jgi:riboflavin synthase